jgi:very-short-patch-repair endonuclease/restriction endonuclease S subunit
MIPKDVLPACVNQHVSIIRLDPQRADAGYVLSFLTHPDVKSYIESFNAGGSRRAITKGHIESFRLPLPPLPEQRAIAHILGTLDDKIELNRRMNETLEAMARALFKSWFIDFDPVRRNAARTRNQPSPGLRPPSPSGRGSESEGAKHEGEGSKHYRGGYDFTGLVQTARALRKKQTPAEDLFWELVRDRQFMGLKFRRQHQLGDYIADFYCHEHRLVIELDGGIHSAKHQKDHKRDAWMEAQEFTVLRFRNEQLIEDPESVLTAIAEIIQAAPTHSLPLGEGTGEGVVAGALPSPSGRGAGGESMSEAFFRPLPLGEGRGEGVVAGEAYDHLFPDSFEDSELGEIPRGWEVKSVGDLADVVGGTTPSTKEPAYWDGGTHAWATPKDLSGLSVPVLLDTERRITDAGLSQVGSGLLPKGTVLLSSRAPIGYLAVAEIPVAINQGFIAMVPKTGTPNLFLLFWASVAHEEIVSRANGSTFLEISKANFRPISVVSPSVNIMKEFERLVRPLYERIVENVLESRTLENLRDSLLPKLISGELRVKKGKRSMGGAI